MQRMAGEALQGSTELKRQGSLRIAKTVITSISQIRDGERIRADVHIGCAAGVGGSNENNIACEIPKLSNANERTLMPNLGSSSVEQLRSVISRIEKLLEEKAAIASDIRDIYAEAGGSGLCPKTIRQIIKLRSMDASEREEQETVLATYCRALGMQADLFDDEDAA